MIYKNIPKSKNIYSRIRKISPNTDKFYQISTFYCFFDGYIDNSYCLFSQISTSYRSARADLSLSHFYTCFVCYTDFKERNIQLYLWKSWWRPDLSLLSSSDFKQSARLCTVLGYSHVIVLSIRKPAESGFLYEKILSIMYFLEYNL